MNLLVMNLTVSAIKNRKKRKKKTATNSVIIIRAKYREILVDGGSRVGAKTSPYGK